MTALAMSYSCVSNRILDLGISPRAQSTFHALLSYRNRRTGLCNPKQQTLADRFGCGLRTIERAFSELRAAGMILVRRTLVGNHYEMTTPERWTTVNLAVPHPPNMAGGTRHGRRVEAVPSLLTEPDVYEPEEGAAAVGGQHTLPVQAAAASTRLACQAKNPTPTPPAPAPTFEERYGPWICAGCGKPHKLGDACPGDAPSGSVNENPAIREAAAEIAGELMAVHPEPGNLPRAVAEAAKLLSSVPGEVPATVEALRASHASWRARWAEYGPGRFIPQLARWLRDGDWRNAPAERKDVKRETWIERREREQKESDEGAYRRYAELGAWDILREYGDDEFVEEWRAKVEAVA